MKRKKVVKLRGSKTHGYGAKKKHRGAGSRGGRGYAGSKKHKKFWIMKNEPNRLGKRGFKSLKKRNIKKEGKSINLKDLSNILSKTEKPGKIIDLRKLGYSKLLGSGFLNKSVVIVVDSFSKKTEEKVKEAGGKIITS